MKTALIFNDVSYLNTAIFTFEDAAPGVKFDVVAEGNTVALVANLNAAQIELLKAGAQATNQNIAQHKLTDEDVAVLASSITLQNLDDVHVSNLAGISDVPDDVEEAFQKPIAQNLAVGSSLAEQGDYKNSAPFAVIVREPSLAVTISFNHATGLCDMAEALLNDVNPYAKCETTRDGSVVSVSALIDEDDFKLLSEEVIITNGQLDIKSDTFTLQRSPV